MGEQFFAILTQSNLIKSKGGFWWGYIIQFYACLWEGYCGSITLDGICNHLNKDPISSMMQVGVGKFWNFILTISYNSIC
jgi:hypothetical protein